MQVDPFKFTLKAPGTERLKLKYYPRLSVLLQCCFQIQIAPLHEGELDADDADAHCVRQRAAGRGLTLAHFTAQLEDLRNPSLTLELNLSTFGTHPRVHWVLWGTTYA